MIQTIAIRQATAAEAIRIITNKGKLLFEASTAPQNINPIKRTTVRNIKLEKFLFLFLLIINPS
jgi:hypothetical protein